MCASCSVIQQCVPGKVPGNEAPSHCSAVGYQGHYHEPFGPYRTKEREPFLHSQLMMQHLCSHFCLCSRSCLRFTSRSSIPGRDETEHGQSGSSGKPFRGLHEEECFQVRGWGDGGVLNPSHPSTTIRLPVVHLSGAPAARVSFHSFTAPSFHPTQYQSGDLLPGS